MSMGYNPYASQGDGITSLDLDLLLLHIVQSPSVLNFAYGQLDPEMLSAPGEVAHRHIWGAIKEHYKKYSRLPTYESACVISLNSLSTDPIASYDTHTAESLEADIRSILSFVYDSEGMANQLEPDLANDIMRRVLIARGPQRDLHNALLFSGGSTDDIVPVVEAAQSRIQNIKSMGSNKVVSAETIPLCIEGDPVIKCPTGVDFIDRIMGGGSNPGDCNVILGPTGGGKTTLSMQLAVSRARLEYYSSQLDADSEPGFVVFVSYEDGLKMLQSRVISCAAKIHKDRAMAINSESELSRRGNLLPYERALYASEGNGGADGELLGEYERLEQVRHWARTHLALIDFRDRSNGGGGHVAEIKQHIMSLQDARGLPVKTVIIDWAGLLVDNYLNSRNKASDGGTHSYELQRVIAATKDLLASPFNCTVWVAHQLKGQVSKLSPARLPHHAEAQWCSAFSDQAWYAFVLGVKDTEHSVCQFAATKTRHSATPPPVLLKVDGALSRMVDVSQQFVIDPISNRLLPRRDISQFHVSSSGGNSEFDGL